VITITLSSAGALAGYERLRSCALGEAVNEPGFVLLMRRGLRSWLEARETAATHAKAAPASSTDSPPGANLRDELARLVASMALCAGRKQAQA
jgi:hypothetical protein